MVYGPRLLQKESKWSDLAGPQGTAFGSWVESLLMVPASHAGKENPRASSKAGFEQWVRSFLASLVRVFLDEE